MRLGEFFHLPTSTVLHIIIEPRSTIIARCLFDVAVATPCRRLNFSQLRATSANLRVPHIGCWRRDSFVSLLILECSLRRILTWFGLEQQSSRRWCLITDAADGKDSYRNLTCFKVIGEPRRPGSFLHHAFPTLWFIPTCGEPGDE